jgi:hypothetical protein
LLDGDDVAAVLSGSSRATGHAPAQIEREHVSDIATKLIAEAVDVVYSDNTIGGIELHTTLPTIGEDTYEPPTFDTQAMADNAQSRHEAYMKTALHDIDLKVPSVLDLNEKDAHLVARSGRIEERDYGTAADILTDLDEAIDDRLGSFEAEFASSSLQLDRLERRMTELAKNTEDASIEQLIQMADDLRHLEEELVQIDPERQPLPPFEEDVIERKKRTVSRRKKSSTSKTAAAEMDSFVPEGDWEVNESSVEMLDLLEQNAPAHRKISLSTIEPAIPSPSGEEE